MIMVQAKGFLGKILEKEDFSPGALSFITNPFYYPRKGLHENLLDLSPKLKGTLLDVGCGQKPYEKLTSASKYVGLEYDSPENRKNKKADYFYNGKKFPFKEKEFDSVLTSQVLEHVFEPDLFLSEINRVMKRGGLLLLTVPFSWDEHEQPVDFGRYSSFGLKYILNKHGFEIIEQRKSVSGIKAALQMINCYTYKKFFTKRPKINLFIGLFLVFPINVLAGFLGLFFPKNEDFYLDNIVLAKKVN